MGPVAQPYPFQQLPGSVLRRLPAELEGDLHVLPGGERRDELECLEHEADFLGPEPGPLILVERAQVLAIQLHPAGGRAVQSRQEPEQSRLAAAARAQDREEPAGGQAERDILQHREGPPAREVRLGECLASQHESSGDSAWKHPLDT